jgi:type IV secretion system protein VirD4
MSQGTSLQARTRLRRKVRRVRLTAEIAGWGSAAVVTADVLRDVVSAGGDSMSDTTTAASSTNSHHTVVEAAGQHAATATAHPTPTPSSTGGAGNGFLLHFLEHPPHITTPEILGGVGVAAGLFLAADRYYQGRRNVSGLATRRQLRRMSRKHILKEAREQLPLLKEMSKKQLKEVGPTRYALPLGVCAAGPRADLYVSYKDVGIIVAPAQTGKSALLGKFMIDCHGPALCTNTKLDLYEETAPIRSKFGKLWLLNLDEQGYPPVPTNFRWNPVKGCHLEKEALERGASLVQAAGENMDVTDAGYWLDKAGELLACFLHAAAITNRTMFDVWRWVNDHRDGETLEILQTNENAAPGWAGRLSSLQSLDSKHLTSIYETCSKAVKFMLRRDIAALTVPDDQHPEFDIDAFLMSRDTVYLVGENTPGSNIAPFFLAFTAALHSRAKVLATRRPGRRHDPAVLFVIDEAALICPVPLDSWAADSGGRGICLWIAAQAYSQLEQRYGVLGARTIKGSANVQILLGGIADDEYLESVSKLVGDHDVDRPSETQHPSNGMGGGGVSRSKTTSKERIVAVSAIREMEMWHGLVVYRNAKGTIMRYDPVWKHPARIAYNKQLKKKGRR